MDSESEQVDLIDQEYDGRYGKRWYYRLSSNDAGEWFWEPRLPRPAEIAAAHGHHRGSRESMLVRESEWPSQERRGPYAQQMAAMTAAHEWLDPFVQFVAETTTQAHHRRRGKHAETHLRSIPFDATGD